MSEQDFKETLAELTEINENVRDFITYLIYDSNYFINLNDITQLMYVNNYLMLVELVYTELHQLIKN